MGFNWVFIGLNCNPEAFLGCAYYVHAPSRAKLLTVIPLLTQQKRILIFSSLNNTCLFLDSSCYFPISPQKFSVYCLDLVVFLSASMYDLTLNVFVECVGFRLLYFTGESTHEEESLYYYHCFTVDVSQITLTYWFLLLFKVSWKRMTSSVMHRLGFLYPHKATLFLGGTGYLMGWQQE